MIFSLSITLGSLNSKLTIVRIGTWKWGEILHFSFALFGELFDGAIQNGLAAIQTQHPGFYFQSAANQAVERRNAARMLCSDPIYYQASDPLAELSPDRCECYGQRLWRTTQQSIQSGSEVLDSAAEQAGFFSLKWKEARVDHTNSFVIPLLNSSMGYFKVS